MYILDFYLFLLVHIRYIISSISIFICYYKFDFHLYIKPCLTDFKYGTYTQDYILTYSGITFYIMLLFLSYDRYSCTYQHIVVICVSSDVSLKVIEHVHGVINRYIKEDVQLDGTTDELIVKSSTVVIDSSDIIDDQVNELDVFMGEMEDEYEEKEKWKMSVARNTTRSTLLYRHIISFH